MRTPLIVLAAALAALAACDKPKPRVVPPRDGPPGMVAAPQAPLPPEPASAALVKRPGMPGFYLDHVGKVLDPMNNPAVVPADEPLVLGGFGFDMEAKVPAKAVDVVIDGKPWPTRYGAPRQDVAVFYKTPGLVAVGFSTTLPAGTLAPGPHVAIVRVIAPDGVGYYESPAITFQVK